MEIDIANMVSALGTLAAAYFANNPIKNAVLSANQRNT